MTGRNDGLAELLVKLAADTAALIDKARTSGAFRATAQTVHGESVVRPVADKPASGPADGAADGLTNAQTGALQDIIVQQAMRVHALEAEVARLTAALAAAEAAVAEARTRPAAKARPKPAEPKSSADKGPKKPAGGSGRS